MPLWTIGRRARVFSGTIAAFHLGKPSANHCDAQKGTQGKLNSHPLLLQMEQKRRTRSNRSLARLPRSGQEPTARLELPGPRTPLLLNSDSDRDAMKSRIHAALLFWAAGIGGSGVPSGGGASSSPNKLANGAPRGHRNEPPFSFW